MWLPCPESKGVTLLLLSALACGCARADDGPARIEINTATRPVTIDVIGVPADTLRTLERAQRDASATVLHVSVGKDQPGMLGSWAIVDRRVRFTPMFPFDAGRPYEVVFTPPGGPPLMATVSLPAHDMTPTTVVSNVFPTADVVPENQLRLYVHFSAPMGRKGGLEHVHLLDADGKEVKDPFLPLDTEFWNGDRTRYTVFFDPGRVKRGIKPNRDMGPSLTEGRTYTLVVDDGWLDGENRKLKGTFTRTFRVGPPDLKPLDPKTWTLSTPKAGSTDPLVVTFPEALDHGLLLRAMSVVGPDGKAIDGRMQVGDKELTWTFAPQSAWRAGSHALVVASSLLEDLAGNRIGRPFEVDQFDRADRAPEPQKTSIPFVPR